MAKVNYSARDVLDQLDDDARRNAGFFPDFDHGYNYRVDGRLTVYGDADDWVVIIEQLAVNPRRGNGAAGICLELYFHGHSVVLPSQPGWGEHAVYSLSVCSDGPSGPLEDQTTFQVNTAITDLQIRSQVVPVRTEANYYWARKIDAFGVTSEQIDEWIEGARQLDDPAAVEQAIAMYEGMRVKVGTFQLQIWDFARGLVPEYRDLLLSTAAERRRGVPNGLPQLLQIEEWDHPRLMEGELPSTSESFKLIAEVLASGDPSLYRPTEPSNTHWSNWPISGSL